MKVFIVSHQTDEWIATSLVIVDKEDDIIKCLNEEILKFNNDENNKYGNLPPFIESEISDEKYNIDSITEVDISKSHAIIIDNGAYN